MKRLVTLASLAVAFVVAAGLLTACSANSGSGFTYKTATKHGALIPVSERKPAENVGGNLINGGRTTLSADKGKVVVVTFWATWCGPCTVETPQFDSLYRSVKSKGIDVLGINTADQKSKAQAFIKDNDISFPVVFDEDGNVLLKLGNLPSAGLPISVLIDRQQRVAAVYVGRLATEEIMPALTTLASET